MYYFEKGAEKDFFKDLFSI